MQKAFQSNQTTTTGVQLPVRYSVKPKEGKGTMEETEKGTEGGSQVADRLEERIGKGDQQNSTHTGSWADLRFLYW